MDNDTTVTKERLLLELQSAAFHMNRTFLMHPSNRGEKFHNQQTMWGARWHEAFKTYTSTFQEVPPTYTVRDDGTVEANK